MSLLPPSTVAHSLDDRDNSTDRAHYLCLMIVYRPVLNLNKISKINTLIKTKSDDKMHRATLHINNCLLNIVMYIYI